MRVFVTGASGHVGSALVPELLSHGHEVVGLARSDASADALAAAGAEVRRGDLGDTAGLAEAAAAADGVVHLAFRHELLQQGDMEGASVADRAAIDAIGAALAGSGKPFVGTTGTALLSLIGHEGVGTEEDFGEGPGRVANENAVIALADQGVRSSVVRLTPTVHSDLDKHGFVPGLIAIARERGYAGYPGEGANVWPAVHTRDAAVLYRLALESAAPGTRLHAVADEGVPFREIAAAIGRGLDVPVRSIAPDEAEEYFTYLARFVGLDNPSSSALTREWLGWEPTHPGLIEDLGERHYFELGEVPA